MILVKNLKLFPVFILVKIGQENLLDDILEKKKRPETMKTGS